jgi:hypothetical protein
MKSNRGSKGRLQNSDQDKHSSLFCFSTSDEEKMFYNPDASHQYFKANDRSKQPEQNYLFIV